LAKKIRLASTFLPNKKKTKFVYNWLVVLGKWLIFKMNADEFKNLLRTRSIKEQSKTMKMYHSTEVYSRRYLNGFNKRTVDRFK